MKSRLDIIGIGNAMVDAIVYTTQEEVEKSDFIRDSMNLIDEDKKEFLHHFYNIQKMIGGGSVGNSMYGITSFGGNGSFIGKIKDDSFGQFLIDDMKREGLKFPLGYTSQNTPTGCCTLFVEKDGTRTMATFLGAGTLICPEDIKKENVINHQIAYLEGYLWDNKNAKKAMKKMIDLCKADQQKIALTLSDQFCIDRHRESFKQLIENDVDIIFANRNEILSMAETSNMDKAITYAKSLGIITVITIGEKGSLIIHDDSVIKIEAKSVPNVIDVTGAGDLYAAGFLFGLAKGKSLEECGEYGSTASSEIISHYGARPEVKLSTLI
jgi:sugar/nucleoside kinase (ribokinase family)